jgi:sugar diacid utilization regulator
MIKIMSEQVTKEDLRQFNQIIINEIRDERKKEEFIPDWIKSRVVKKSLSISAASLQSLRITRKVRCRKILGFYYYSKTDLTNLFKD